MSRQFNTQNYRKPRFKKVYLNFIDNLGHYDFRGIKESDQGITLHLATASDFYMAQTVAINYAYLGGIIHECNYELNTTGLGNGREYVFNLNTVKLLRVPGDGGRVTSVMAFDYARAAFKTCYNPNGGWGGHTYNPQPNLVGLSPIMSITVRFAGSTSNPQVQMNTVYSELRSQDDQYCNRLHIKEYEPINDGHYDYQDVKKYIRYESWGNPGVAFTANDANSMTLSLFDNQTDPRETIPDQPNINVPIAAVQHIDGVGNAENPGFDFNGNKSAPLAYFIEEEGSIYRFNLIRSCENAFNVDGVFTGEYEYGLVCKSLLRYSDSQSIDNWGDLPTNYNNRLFNSYPETTRFVDYRDSL